jgi:hypothetical protein
MQELLVSLRRQSLIVPPGHTFVPLNILLEPVPRPPQANLMSNMKVSLTSTLDVFKASRLTWF